MSSGMSILLIYYKFTVYIKPACQAGGQGGQLGYGASWARGWHQIHLHGQPLPYVSL